MNIVEQTKTKKQTNKHTESEGKTKLKFIRPTRPH